MISMTLNCDRLVRFLKQTSLIHRNAEQPIYRYSFLTPFHVKPYNEKLKIIEFANLHIVKISHHVVLYNYLKLHLKHKYPTE